MKLLLTLIVVTATINSKLIGDISNIDYDPYTGPLAIQGYHFEGHLVAFNHTSSLAARSRRATNDDNLTISIIRMQMIARLTNAIYLQQSLMDGKISSEKLISELLHFGPVTPKQVHALEEKTVNAALREFNELPKKVKQSTAIDDLETLFTSIGSLLKILDGVDNIEIWPGKEDFKADMDSLANGKADYDFITKLDDAVTETKTYFRSAKKSHGVTNLDNTHYGHFINLKKALTSLIECGVTLSKGIPEVFKFKTKQSAVGSFSFMKQVAEAVDKKIGILFTTSGDDFLELETNVVNTLNVINKVGQVKSNLEHIRDLLFSRSKKGNPHLVEFTFGLPHGTKDINRLPGHFNDPWFKEVVKSGGLAAALKSLDSVDKSVSNIEQALPRDVEQKIVAISNIIVSYDHLFKVFSNFNKNSAEEVRKCVKLGSTEKVPSNNITALNLQAKSIDDALAEIKNMLAHLKTLLNEKDNLDMMNAVIKVCEQVKLSDEASLKEAIKQLGDYSDLKKMDAFVVSMVTATGTIGTQKTTLENLASSFNFPLIDAYQTKVNEHAPFFNCLLENKDTSRIVDVVSESKALRNFDGKQEEKVKFDNAMASVTAIASTKNDLKSLETTIKSIKGFKSTESDLLKLLPNPSIHSKVIGSATRGITSMKTAIDEKSNINGINKHVKVVKDEKKENEKKLRAEDMKNLKDFVDWLEDGNDKSLDNLFNELETWKSRIKKSKSTKLEDYAIIFLDAKTVGGIQKDLGQMSVSLGKLIGLVDDSTNKKSLQEVQKALDYLDGIGSHKKDFDDSKKSLAQLDMFFANYAKQISVTTPPPIQLTATWTPAPIMFGALDLSTTLKPLYEEGWFQIVCGVIATIVTLIGIASLYYRFVYMKKKQVLIPTPIPPPNGIFTIIMVVLADAFGYLQSYWEQIVAHIVKIKNPPEKPKPAVKPERESREQTKKREKDDANAMKLWNDAIKRKAFLQTNSDIHFECDTDMKEDKPSDFLKQHRKECRHLISMSEKTRVTVPTNKSEMIHFDTDFFHGNWVTMPNFFKMILTQGPHPKSKTKKGTYNKFWYVANRHKSRSIIQLCDFYEFDIRDGSYSKKCDVYFPLKVDETMTFDHYTVKCTKVEVDVEGELITRTLVLSSDGEPIQEIIHYQYLGWPDHGVPENADTIIKILLAVRNQPETVIVHCSAGIGRSGSFAFIELAYQTLYFNKKIDFGALLRDIREMRARSIQYPNQFSFCIYALFVMLFHGVNLDEIDKKDKNKFKYEKEREQLRIIREAYKEGRDEDFNTKKAKWGGVDLEKKAKIGALYGKTQEEKMTRLRQMKVEAEKAEQAKLAKVEASKTGTAKA